MSATYPYKLLIVTPIPVVQADAGHRTLDLWVRDLQTQVATTGPVTILAPLARAVSGNPARVPDGVRVVTHDHVQTDARLRELVETCDVVAVNTGSPRRRSRMQCRAAETARRAGRCLIACVTSNRAKTTRLNSRGKSFPARLKSRLIARGIERTQRKLVRMADGVLVVGHGVSSAMRFGHPNEYVETASWIGTKDILPAAHLEAKLARAADPLRACIATRLEPMKGVHVGIEAMRLLDNGAMLTIFGAGPSLADLQAGVSAHRLEKRVCFGGTFAYPEPFLSEIGKFDVILLTNLNDEQPRLIFDALARGVLPLCPDSEPYRRLALPSDILYRRGDAASLAQTLQSVRAADLPRLLEQITPVLRANTVDAMHRKRADWIADTMRSGR